MKMPRFRLLVVSLFVFTLGGCNTFKGVGKDLEGAGDAIRKAADKTGEAMKK